jgi:hypothetical protein
VVPHDYLIGCNDSALPPEPSTGVAVVSTAGAFETVSTTTAVESLASDEPFAPHEAMVNIIAITIAPIFAFVTKVLKRLALYNARVVKKSRFCSLVAVAASFRLFTNSVT